ncbi:DsbA family protein [Sphingomonas sp. LT1P40]|uniref:DsbA family protein n=1 Tax=Alteristakelama amylovorans TaxID=3096166 RepID=UPI002FCBC0A2
MRIIRLMLAVATGMVFAASAPAQPARDWRTHVVQTASGAFVIGNPAAKVKLVEYLSYTCGHCAEFVAESKVPLHDQLVRKGAVQVEVRHAVRDPLDLTAALLARCSGPRGFSGATQAIFAAQADWYQQGAAWWQANGAAMQSQPELKRLRAAATGSGLDQLMQRRGMTPAAINACFANPADLNKLTAMAKAAWTQIKGTPSFTINGKAGGGNHWETLEPELRAAGAR